jgi:hypothetical protein
VILLLASARIFPLRLEGFYTLNPYLLCVYLLYVILIRNAAHNIDPLFVNSPAGQIDRLANTAAHLIYFILYPLPVRLPK